MTERRFSAIPDELGALVMALAGAQGRPFQWADARTLEVDGPLAAYRFVIDIPIQRGMPLPWEAPLKAVAEHTVAILQALGAFVLVTAGDQEDSSVSSRAAVIRDFGAHALISLRVGKHASTTVRGLRALTNGRILTQSRKLAESLLQRVALRTGLPSRGIPLFSGLPVDVEALAAKAALPIVGLEVGCATCPADEAALNGPDFQVRCACGLAEGILRFFGQPDGDLAELADRLRIPAPGLGDLPPPEPLAGVEPAAGVETPGESPESKVAAVGPEEAPAPQPAGDVVAASEAAAAEPMPAAPTPAASVSGPAPVSAPPPPVSVPVGSVEASLRLAAPAGVAQPVSPYDPPANPGHTYPPPYQPPSGGHQTQAYQPPDYRSGPYQPAGISAQPSGPPPQPVGATPPPVAAPPVAGKNRPNAWKPRDTRGPANQSDVPGTRSGGFPSGSFPPASLVGGQPGGSQAGRPPQGGFLLNGFPSGGFQPVGPQARGTDSDGPEPMMQSSDGSWISPRAYAVLKQLNAQEQSRPPQTPRVTPEGQVIWPGLPRGFNPTRKQS
ncbi:MAG TPA: N-acetylmuramoyl-L-alanine amidase [Symbiobacteriaceae bacterium]